MGKITSKGLTIGVIMDGNGRWAKEKGLSRTEGHKQGVDVFEKIYDHARLQEAKAMIFYAFSSENWSRPKKEVDYLMAMFDKNLEKLKEKKYENNRVMFIGDKSVFKKRTRRDMDELEENSKYKTGTVLAIAVNYGGRQELVKATKEIAEDVKNRKISLDDIDVDMISRHLYTADIPDPDFIIRTSGEKRLSNFLMWQSAYSEFIFPKVYWPDFTTEDFDKAVEEFYSRNRRFGGV